MKKQTEITDDIIKNKFDEILSSKNIEEQQIMGSNNIDEIKKYEFLRECFVEEAKYFIKVNRDGASSCPLNLSYSRAYDRVSEMVEDSATAIYNAITRGDFYLVENLFTILQVDPNIKLNKNIYNNFLEVAYSKKNKEMVKRLLEKGADPSIEFYSQVRNHDNKAMGFDNIDDYSEAKAAINDSSKSDAEKSVLNAKIKKHEFFRDSFVKKFKASIEDQSKYIEIFSSDIYYDIFKISLDPISVIVKAINQGDYDLVDSLLTALDIKPNIIAASECDVGSLLYLAWCDTMALK